MKKKKTMTNIHETFRSPGVRLVLVVAIPMVVLLVLILIYMITKPVAVEKPRLTIDNFSEMMPGVPEETERLIEERLYDEVALSLGDGGSVPKSGAMIRSDTADGFSVLDDFHVGDFIVDIASVEESYIAEFFYGELEGQNEMEGDASVTFYCIEDPALVKYPEFRCKANRDFVKPDGINYILPATVDGAEVTYTYSTTSASGYAVVVEYNPSESVYKAGQVGEYKMRVMGEVREFIKKAGLNPDDYEYIEKFKVVR